MSPHNDITWSDIDKFRFYTIGTGLYSGLTILLHPMTVFKTRQQVLTQSPNNSHASSRITATANSILRQQKHFSTRAAASPHVQNLMHPVEKIRAMYRGLGVVLSIAIPARGLYVYVLEGSRENIANALTRLTPPGENASLFTTSSSSGSIATLSGGIAGGVAALSAQILVVPMDVISQKQMIHGGSVFHTVRSALEVEGWRGLYRGFGMSMVNSLPTGSVWWAAYAGCQHRMKFIYTPHDDENRVMIKRGLVQFISGMTAATVASVMTQPLDVVKVRYQVGMDKSVGRLSTMGVAQDLFATVGIRGFFRGTIPRIMHMGLWGTVLSSAYEYLKHVSRKDHLR